MKKILKNKIVLFSIIGLLFLSIVIVIIMLLNKNKLTELERVKINEASQIVENYLDEITLHNDTEGKYIDFAIELLYNETDKELYSIEDVLNVINGTFDIDYKEEELLKVGITSEMVDKGIVFDSTNNSFKYNSGKTKADIAATPIIKYSINKINKKDNNTFEVKYDKFIVENPNEIYNYFVNENIERSSEEEKYDTKDIIAYLKGEEKIGKIKKIINSENIKEFGKIEDGPTIKYILKDDKLLIGELK